MSLDTHVQVTLTVNNAGVALAGFGLIGVVTYKNLFTGRIAFFNRLADVISQGYDADSYEAIAVGRILAQSPHPTQVALVKGTLAPTQRYLVEALEVRNSFVYGITVEGEGVTSTDVEYTSDAASTLSEVHNGLVTQLNAVTGKNYTAAFAPLVFADQTFVAEADDETITTANALVNPDDVFTADNATEIFTAAAHGLLTGDGPFQVSNGGGALPTGLLALTDYWFIRIDADTFYLATTLANALAGTHLSISTDGTGVQTIADTAETRRVVAHTLVTGDGPFQVSNAGGALPAGLVAATDYWAIVTGTYTFKFASTLANALAGTPAPLTTDGTGVQTMVDTADTKRPSDPFTVTGSAAGEWFSLAMVDRSALSAQQNHADPGVATDLAAIQVADSSWYYLHTTFNSDDYVKAAAAWVESNGKMYYPDISNTECENTADGNSEVGDDIEALGYKRTVPFYHARPAAMAGAALMGRLAPLNPGKWTAAYKTLSGVEFMSFTATQIANLDARKMTYYKREAGRSITWEGKVGNTDFGYADITTALDWFLDRLQKRVFGVFVAKNKVAYTDEDIAEFKGAAEGVVLLAQSDAYTIVAPGTPGDENDPVPTVSFPRVRDIDAGTRALRQVPDGNVSFRMQGAAHSVIFDVTISF